MSNALNTKILLAILVTVAAIAGAVAWQQHNTRDLQRKAEQQRKAFWDKVDVGRKGQPHYTFNPTGH
jgi:hypothetical protein